MIQDGMTIDWDVDIPVDDGAGRCVSANLQ
jgi:hypothetical protein